MENAVLLSYLRDARAAGLDSRTIGRALAEAGWQIGDVLEEIMGLVTPAGRQRTTSAPGRPAIFVQNLKKSFGSVQALDDISFSVQPGTVLALLGPNGAGKTTLVRILSTLLKPDAGWAMLYGHAVASEAAYLRGIIGLTGQFAAIDGNLTGRENIELVGRLYHLAAAEAKDRTKLLLEQFDLSTSADRPAKTYSGGMKRRLDLAASLVGQPALLFLDEPTTGLDPPGRNRLWQMINERVAEGTTVLLTTQYMDEAEHLADQIVVLDRGQIIAQGTAAELKKQVGGDVLELHLADHAQLEEAVVSVAPLGTAQPQLDAETGRLILPISGGARVLTEAVRRLDNAGINIADAVLRRPSLDDVFVALTGHRAAA